ncbi:kinase-like domain, phloem protein 2-like protein [Tanacetum coccineum]
MSNFEFSSLDSLHQHIDHVSDHAYGTFAYLDPEYTISGILTDKSDLYSFGVILVEILCGRLAWGNGCEDQSQSLGPLAKRRFEEGKLNEMVFEGIKKEIVPESYSSFSNIAYECLRDDGYERPEAREVVIQLKEALEFQWFSLSKTGKDNAMISATMFSYGNRTSHKWRYIQRSRFHRVAKMMDMTNLKIQIKIKTEILSMDIVYGVHLVFKFCDPGKVSNNPIYVNLKYKMGSETSHAYFAKHRDDDGWMMIELSRFLNQKEVNVFEVSLESFSRYYCGSGAIYVQGIEFQAIECTFENILWFSMKKEEIKILNGNQQVPKPDVNEDQMQQRPNDLGETIYVQSEVNGKKHLMISATKVLFNSHKMKFFHRKPSAESRFQNVMELLPQQVFRIKYKIESEMLSPFTEYVCYLVFKLSEKCRELHCPVKVRDLLHRRNKETKNLYFRTSAPFNRH